MTQETNHDLHTRPTLWPRKMVQTMTWFLLLILVALIGFFGLLLVWSPGKLAPLVNDAGQPIEGSLSEKIFVEINGTRQGMFIQSANPSNPVLLFLHGGPGMVEFFLQTTHPSGIEQDFTVVWWEQRGAGMSYDPAIPLETMTLDQLISDTIAVTNYLRRRFGHDKIYLLGHSWGSFLGIQVAAKAPDLFHAYIGMGQLTHQLRSEVAARDYLVAAYQARGDTAMVRRLNAAPVSLAEGTSDAWMRLRDEAMHRLGVGTTRDMASVITGVFVPIWRNPAYTLREKIAIWRGKAWSRSILWDEILHTDLTVKVPRLEIPVYFFLGQHDYTTNYDLARDYYQSLIAPVKGFYTFNDSAHSPMFEEPRKARNILRQDVLARKNTLSDPIQPEVMQ